VRNPSERLLRGDALTNMQVLQQLAAHLVPGASADGDGSEYLLGALKRCAARVIR
jgi:hypothetical protein